LLDTGISKIAISIQNCHTTGLKCQSIASDQICQS